MATALPPCLVVTFSHDEDRFFKHEPALVTKPKSLTNGHGRESWHNYYDAGINVKCGLMINVPSHFTFMTANSEFLLESQLIKPVSSLKDNTAGQEDIFF